MELGLNGSFVIVTGASSGFGAAITKQLVEEGALVLAVARDIIKLERLKFEVGQAVDTMSFDVTLPDFPEKLILKLDGRIPAGLVVNAGGPPAGGFSDISPERWDKAYNDILLWKVNLLNMVIPLFKTNGYGRILMIESVSVKQPVEGLILSNTFRPAVVGLARTLASELAGNAVTVNVLAPGYHETEAMQRLYQRKSNQSGISLDEAKQSFIYETGMGKMGDPVEFAQLATWLLSPSSSFITGQVFSVAGNLVKGIFG